jgi:spermidine synthase
VTRPIAIALTALTGFTGLVYEVTWQKYLATLLGSHAEATAGVLAIFLGGLSAGYAGFGRVTRRRVARFRETGQPTRLLVYYASLEAAIGLIALLFPFLFGVVSNLTLTLPVSPPALSLLVDLLMCVILVGPPAFLMGGTIPILTLALAEDRNHATRVHAWIYGVNTAGAAAGALGAAFVLIPGLGLDRTLYAMGALNLFAGCVFAWLGIRNGRVEPLSATSDEPEEAPSRRFLGYAAVALLAGFAMMALQTILNRIAGLAFGSSHFTFAVVVAIFVSCIAAGSLAVSALRTIPRWLIVASQWGLVLVLFWLYSGIEDAPYWAFVLRGVFSQHTAAFYPFQLASATALFALFALPIGLSGALLPLLFHQLRGEMGELGSVAGRLYSWNTVGSLLGALIGGYVLLFWLDLDQIYRVSIAALSVGAAILTVLVFRVSAVLTSVLVVLPIMAALWISDGWSPERLSAGLFRKRVPPEMSLQGPDAFFEQRASPKKIIFYEDDPTATIAVRAGEPIDGRANLDIVTNGKSDGNLVLDYPTMAMSALVPALLAEDPVECFVIGLGTGVSAGELAALESVQRVEVAEISRAVIEAAPLFDVGNLDASKNSKIHVERGDAYRTLLRSARQRFDVIVSEPSNPWVTGVEMLYSVEFLEAARARLSPGGVYAQWFHLYEVDIDTVELVMRTYTSVFPHVAVWYTLESDLLLLGFNRGDHALDVNAVAERFEQPDFVAGFARAGIEGLPALLAHEVFPLGVLNEASLAGPVHTLHRPILSDMAARAFFVGRRADDLSRYLNRSAARVGRENSLLGRLTRPLAAAEYLAALQAASYETCKQARRLGCATLLARWRQVGGQADVEELLRKLRSKASSAEALKESNLRMIEVLLEGRPRRTGKGKSLARAKALSDAFLRHYHHAEPFDRRALTIAWDRCREDGCDEAREHLEDRIGSLPAAANRRQKP